MKNLIIDYIVFTLINVFQAFNLKIIFDKFLLMERSKNRKNKYLWLLYVFIIVYLMVYFRFYKMTVLMAILLFVYYLRFVPFIWSIYKISFKSLLIVFFYEEIVSFMASNVLYILSAITDINMDYDVNDVFTLMATFIIFITLMLFLLLKRKGILSIRFVILNNYQYIMITLIIYFTGLLEGHIWLYDHNNFLRVISFLDMLLMGLLILSIMSYTENKKTLDSKYKILNESIEKLTGYYIQLGEKETELRKFRHDIKNHMMILDSMVAEGKNDEALEYMNNMGILMANTKPRFDTGNYIADAILDSKYSIASGKGISINFEGVISSENIENTDMVILLANILDNAIEACEKVDKEKEIKIESIFNKGIWILTVENPVKDLVDITNDKIDTTKSDKELHGYGLSNIKSVAKKYGGMVKLENRDNKFLIKVVTKC